MTTLEEDRNTMDDTNRAADSTPMEDATFEAMAKTMGQAAGTGVGRSKEWSAAQRAVVADPPMRATPSTNAILAADMEPAEPAVRQDGATRKGALH